eukprot:gene443-888_t
MPPSISTTPKIIHVIRHGEAEHNVDWNALHKRDTKLTKEGRRQARELGKKLVHMETDVVLTSPVLRALQTTKHMLSTAKNWKKSHVPEVILDLRERVSSADHLCEFPIDPKRALTGNLKRDFGKYDWKECRKQIKSHGGKKKFEAFATDFDLSEKPDNVLKRAKSLRKYLEQRSEKTITIVSHGAFLMRLCKDDYMDNCELRSYEVCRGKWKRI